MPQIVPKSFAIPLLTLTWTSPTLAKAPLESITRTEGTIAPPRLPADCSALCLKSPKCAIDAKHNLDTVAIKQTKINGVENFSM